jgi:hypothetical protein
MAFHIATTITARLGIVHLLIYVIEGIGNIGYIMGDKSLTVSELVLIVN